MRNYRGFFTLRVQNDSKGRGILHCVQNDRKGQGILRFAQNDRGGVQNDGVREARDKAKIF